MPVTSTTITEPKDWCDGGLLIPHEAIRVMTIPMRKFKLDSPEKVAKFQKWYSEIFYPVVASHHEAEETIYFPWIAEKATFPESMTRDRVGTDHEALMNLMGKIKDSEPDGPAIEAMLKELCDLMDAHLAVEEGNIPGMLRGSGYTKEDEGPVIGKIAQHLGPANAIFMPLILLAMDRADGCYMKSEFFKTLLPPPIQARTRQRARSSSLPGPRASPEAYPTPMRALTPQEGLPKFEEGMKANNLAVMDELCA